MKNCIVLVCLCVVGILQQTDAAIERWTTPVIGTKDGNGAIDTPAIPEDLTAGSATDITLVAEGNAGTISYALTTATSNGVTFTIDTGGILTFSSGTLDFEANPTLEIVVTATDDTTAEGTGTATVTLSITDVNEAPSFTPSAVTVEICNDSVAGTVVTTLTATDPDTTSPNNDITLTITGGDTDGVFSISNVGVITIATGKTVTAGTQYTLTVQVADGGALTGTATVTIVCTTYTTTTQAPVTTQAPGMTTSSSASLVVSMGILAIAIVVAFL